MGTDKNTTRNTTDENAQKFVSADDVMETAVAAEDTEGHRRSLAFPEDEDTEGHRRSL